MYHKILFTELYHIFFQIYADPLGYWKNYYNLFDFFVLCVSALQTILANVAVTRSSLTILTVTRGNWKLELNFAMCYTSLAAPSYHFFFTIIISSLWYRTL